MTSTAGQETPNGEKWPTAAREEEEEEWDPPASSSGTPRIMDPVSSDSSGVFLVADEETR